MTVELGQMLAQVTQVKETINAAEKAILRNVLFKVKRVKSTFAYPSETQSYQGSQLN